ncbi:MAPEG family protein [Vibrio cholerae]|uniref:MAPEG family protein n=1 Tax=Vibrio cholerae TaxID=666 RepID=UPI0029BF29C7|nr:hypothetical protein [Vibrio cholerae]EKF9218635.1 MAPEG family protein [Vibrio cholerae]EKF9229194.1 MAPEG family protein [Vibrio cholerae]ELU8557160.1 MAPEG family protein [Vibrio cholerae]HDL9503933.1 MAPEG family protein [Vibrio cholerae]
MVTTGYAVVLCGWLIYLAVQVIRQRRKHQVLFADGGVDALVRARSAQSNATEYIPIFLILLGLAEMNGVNVWWIHALGVAFVVGRVLHADSMFKATIPNRVRGMQLTFGCLAVLMVLSLWVLPYSKFFYPLPT